MERGWTISDVYQHYDYNSATMLAPKNERFNFDFSFSNYIHVLYKENDFIKLEAEAVKGITSWRFTEGGTTSRAVARGVGYSFVSRPHMCFCEGRPCEHIDFIGMPTAHKVLPSTQEKTDREVVTNFMNTVRKDMPLASQGDLDDTAAGGEPLWLSIAKGSMMVNEEKFTAAGGTSKSGTRSISVGWRYVDIVWLVKVKTDSAGNVHYEEERQTHDERMVGRGCTQ